MGEIDQLRERVAAARRRYAELPRDGWGGQGPEDERTGERWDRGHVLGHVAEFVPFWTGQLRAALENGAIVGRDEVGSAQRRMGIDSGREAGEDGLLGRIDAGLEALDALLGGLTEADLDRRVVLAVRQGTEESDARRALDQLLVGHLEDHLRQLRELPE
jgi:hypothetical protein